jgi:hypothetical protein
LFIALELKPQRAGIIPRLSDILTRPKARLAEHAAFGVRYLRLTAPIKKGGVNWREVEELAGRLSGRLLLPEDIKLPEERPRLAALPCPRYERRMLADTAALIIRRTRMPMYWRVLGLIDRDGAHADLLPGLLRFYTSARVVTAREDIYGAAAEQMMEELGAPVLVGGSLSLLADCVLILALGPAVGEEGAYPCPVLADHAFQPRLPCDLLRDPEPEITRELLASCPPAIPAARFAAALYEDAGAEACGFPAVRIRLCSRRAELHEVVQYVMKSAQTLSLY